LADFVVVNSTELAFFAPGDDIGAELRALRQRPDQVVIATVGGDGAHALIGDDVLHVPGRVVPVVDTTGAGDCFVGALAAALCSWADTDEAVHFANLAASLAVQRFGASSGMPYLSDVEGVK
jgi:ribokinase